MKESNLITSCLFITCMLLCFIFSIVCFTKFNGSDHYYIASIGKNWGTGPVSDVESAGFECPTGKYSIITDEWPGTTTGCYCKGIFSNLYRKQCDHDDYHCTEIFSINPIQFKKWRSTNLCGKRGPNYLRMKTANTKNGCGANYQNCGVLDTIGQFLCYPNNIPCPYNYMKIEDKNYVPPNDNKYTVVNLGNNGVEGKAVFSNGFTSNSIVNEFRVDDKTPCLSPEYKNLHHSPYVLETTYGYDKCSNEIGGALFDESFKKVDSVSYNHLYHDNGIINILTSMPLFNEKYNYVQQTTSLFYKNYIGMKKACIENIIKDESDEEFIMSLVHIEDKINSAKVAAIVGIVFSSIGMFIMIGFIIAACCVGDKDVYMAPMIIILLIVTALPALIIGSIIVSMMNSHNFDLSPLAKPGCTDSITSRALNSFTTKISSAKSMAASYLSFGIIGIFAGIAGLFL